MLQSTASLSRAELRRRWSDWRREVARRKQAGEFTLVPPLHRLARVSEVREWCDRDRRDIGGGRSHECMNVQYNDDHDVP